MNKRVSLLVLLGCVVCIAAFMVAFQAESGELKQKKSHSFSQTRHDQGYGRTDYDCQYKCKSQYGGYNCGISTINCCINESQCSYTWSGQVCNQRVAVPGCTTA